MTVKVECALRFIHQNIIETLEANEDPKYTYTGMDSHSKITMMFEVDSDKPVSEICELTKKIIKSSEMGKTAMFRVIEG